MNRLIKFKALNLEDKWVFGFLDSPNSIVTEIDDTDCNSGEMVQPDSIGQFVGLLDINGKEIYEGDIVQWKDFNNTRFAVVRMAPDICFDCSPIESVMGIQNSSDHIFHYGTFAYKTTQKHLKVIGNVAVPKNIKLRSVKHIETDVDDKITYYNVERYLEEDDLWMPCIAFPTWEKANAWKENEERNLPYKYRITPCHKS